MRVLKLSYVGIFIELKKEKGSLLMDILAAENQQS
jgi:hypothetical protein